MEEKPKRPWQLRLSTLILLIMECAVLLPFHIRAYHWIVRPEHHGFVNIAYSNPLLKPLDPLVVLMLDLAVFGVTALVIKFRNEF